MKRFPLLVSLAAAVVWLLPVVGPFAGSTRASVITTGDVDPGGAAKQPDPWAIAGSSLKVGDSGNGTLNVEAGGVVSSLNGRIGDQSNSTGMATVSGSGSQWNNVGSLSVGDLLVGHDGSGTLNVVDGGVVSNTYGSFGINSGSTGEATVTGAGSQWNNSASLSMGESGTGTLNVESGGAVSNTTGFIGLNFGSTGTATVTGARSRWNNSANLFVGDSGSGTLNVEAGGVVSNAVGYIGYYSDSTGTATVTGANSQWNNSQPLFVGRSGTGTLNVTGGGVVSNTKGYISYNSGSMGIVTVTGADSQWNNSLDLYVGRYGSGTLNVMDGGVVSNTLGSIGDRPGSTGVATVTGADSQWNNSGDLYVGNYGTGTLNITDGGVVSNSESGHIGDQSGSTGEATVAGVGSQWNNSESLVVGYQGTGTLNITDGGVVSNSGGYIGRSSSSRGVVTVTGTGSQWNNSNELLVGREGTLRIENGGSVSSYSGGIESSNSIVIVTGSGSQWNNSSNLENSGTLTVQDGGMVSNLGDISINHTRKFSIDGDGTVSNAGDLYMENATLNISNGADVFNLGDIIIRSGENRIDGDGTVSVSGDLYLVEDECGLSISNGAKVLTTNAYIGNIPLPGYEGDDDFSPEPMYVTVSGTDSVWVVSDDLFIGHNSPSPNWDEYGVPHKLIISDGAEVQVGGMLRVVRKYYDDENEYFNTRHHEVVIDDGTLSVGSLSGFGNLIWKTGTLEITGAAGLTLPLLGGGAYSSEIADWFNLGSSDRFGYPWSTNLTISPDQTLKVSNTTTIETGTKITVLGTFSGDLLKIESGGQFDVPSGYTNHDEIQLNGDEARLTGDVLTNHGLLRGTGRIEATLDNQADGKVRIDHEQQMHFTNTAANQNAGLIHLIGTPSNPAEIEFDGALTNVESTGRITGRNAILHFNDGLDNSGGVALSFGTSDIFGDVNNHGVIVVTGSSSVTFYDDLANDGTVQVSEGSTAVYFGAVSGNSFTGSGTTFVEGDLSPGSSPGSMSFGGDVVLGTSSTTQIELTGTGEGEYDRLLVAGMLELAGELEVQLLDNFFPAVDTEFQIFDAMDLSGTFSSLVLPDLLGDLSWDSSHLYTTGELLVSLSQIAGDFDSDGDVDGDDFLLWQRNFPVLDGTAGSSSGDANGDGNVDGDDFLVWQRNFPYPTAISSVPEPNSLALLAISGLLMLRRRWAPCISHGIGPSVMSGMAI